MALQIPSGWNCREDAIANSELQVEMDRGLVRKVLRNVESEASVGSPPDPNKPLRSCQREHARLGFYAYLWCRCSLIGRLQAICLAMAKVTSTMQKKFTRSVSQEGISVVVVRSSGDTSMRTARCARTRPPVHPGIKSAAVVGMLRTVRVRNIFPPVSAGVMIFCRIILTVRVVAGQVVLGRGVVHLLTCCRSQL